MLAVLSPLFNTSASIREVLDALIGPATSNFTFVLGELVPMPQRPAESIATLDVPDTKKSYSVASKAAFL